LRFEFNGVTQPAMNFWLLDGKAAALPTIKMPWPSTVPRKSATGSVRGAGRGAAVEGDNPTPVKASDITVLVRSRQEAALHPRRPDVTEYPSVYLSNRDSVFETLEAQEMLWLLQAVLAPERESTLRSALASAMLGLNARILMRSTMTKPRGMRWWKSLSTTGKDGRSAA
jgi:exodeoxyribonuclease V beta subunit